MNRKKPDRQGGWQGEKKGKGFQMRHNGGDGSLGEKFLRGQGKKGGGIWSRTSVFQKIPSRPAQEERRGGPVMLKGLERGIDTIQKREKINRGGIKKNREIGRLSLKGKYYELGTCP